MSEIGKLMAIAGRMKPDKDIQVQKLRVGKIPVLVLRPKMPQEKTPALLWIHGGGYFLGMKEMVYMGRAADLVNRFGITVISPGYRLAFQKPYPAALQDCYRTLVFMKKHAAALGIDENKIMVGGESAGGGLPPAYTFVGDGEPFYAETLEYVRKLKEAGIEAEVDVYPSDMHAFDMLDPESEVSRQAIQMFEEKFEKALTEIQHEEREQ